MGSLSLQALDIEIGKENLYEVHRPVTRGDVDLCPKKGGNNRESCMLQLEFPLLYEAGPLPGP